MPNLVGSGIAGRERTRCSSWGTSCKMGQFQLLTCSKCVLFSTLEIWAKTKRERGKWAPTKKHHKIAVIFTSDYDDALASPLMFLLATVLPVLCCVLRFEYTR